MMMAWPTLLEDRAMLYATTRPPRDDVRRDLLVDRCWQMRCAFWCAKSKDCVRFRAKQRTTREARSVFVVP
jgi:hypothetical protein